MFGKRLINTGGVVCPSDNTNLFGDGSGVALYQLNSNADDSSGNYNGTANDVTYVSGYINNAGSFNGSSSYIQSNTRLGLSSNPTHSVSFWINFSGTANQNLYLFGAGTTNFTHSGIYIDTALGRIYHQNNGNAELITNISWSISEWHHIVFTYNSSNSAMELYLDGASVSTATRTLNIASSEFTIGRWSGYNNSYVNGLIDQFRVFNKEVTSTEVTTLYNEVAC